MSIFGARSDADSVRNLIKAKKDEAAAERAMRPEALEPIATLVAKQIERGEKHALRFQFPSEWLPDQGRAVTNRDPEWHRKPKGFPQRAYAYFEKELAPRGFQLRVEILDWPGGMPGDVGFILTRKRPDEE